MCLKYWSSIQNYFMGINKNHFPFEIQFIDSVDIWSSTTLMKRRKIKSMPLIDTTAVHWWGLVGHKRMRVDILSLNQPLREWILRCLFMVQNVYVLWGSLSLYLRIANILWSNHLTVSLADQGSPYVSPSLGCWDAKDRLGWTKRKEWSRRKLDFWWGESCAPSGVVHGPRSEEGLTGPFLLPRRNAKSSWRAFSRKLDITIR